MNGRDKLNLIILQNGTLKIVDRKKNIFKLSQVRQSFHEKKIKQWRNFISVAA